MVLYQPESPQNISMVDLEKSTEELEEEAAASAGLNKKRKKTSEADKTSKKGKPYPDEEGLYL